MNDIHNIALPPSKIKSTTVNLSIFFTIYGILLNVFWSCSATSAYQNLANYFNVNFSVNNFNLTDNLVNGLSLDQENPDDTSEMVDLADFPAPLTVNQKNRFLAMFFLDFITVVLGTLKILFALFYLSSCPNCRWFTTFLSFLCFLTATASMSLITEQKMDEYLDGGRNKYWIFIVGWLSPIFFLIASILGCFTRKDHERRGMGGNLSVSL